MLAEFLSLRKEEEPSQIGGQEIKPKPLSLSLELAYKWGKTTMPHKILPGSHLELQRREQEECRMTHILQPKPRMGIRTLAHMEVCKNPCLLRYPAPEKDGERS